MARAISPIEASPTATVKEFTRDEAEALLPGLKAATSGIKADWEARTAAIVEKCEKEFGGDKRKAWEDVKGYRRMCAERRIAVMNWWNDIGTLGIKPVDFHEGAVELMCIDGIRRLKAGDNDYTIEPKAIGL